LSSTSCGPITKLCGSKKISIPPPQRVSGRPKFLKESMSLNWNFQGSGGFKPKKAVCGESVDIFCNNKLNVFCSYFAN